MWRSSFAGSMYVRKTITFVKRGFIWVLIAFIFLCFIYWIFFIKRMSSTYCYLDSRYGKGFGISFAASFVEGLIFFFVLGILGAIVPAIIARSPDEEDFNTRVTALMNSESAKGNEELVDYLKQYLTTFLAFVSKMTITIVIKDYDTSKEAFKIYTEYDITVSNMCRDSDYKFKQPAIYVSPDISVNGDMGQATYLATYDTKTSKLKETLIDEFLREGVVHLTGEFEKQLEYKISKNETLSWKFRYYIWSKVYDPYENYEKWFVHSFLRYTQNLEIHLENHLKSKLNVIFDLESYKIENGNRQNLAKQDVLVYHSNSSKVIKPSGVFLPGDRLEFYFYRL